LTRTTATPAGTGPLDRAKIVSCDDCNDTPHGPKEETMQLENRLAGETSPYLRQHQHNPVYWQRWNKETFSAARACDRPILLSGGYAACHWRRVIARECCEDAEVAELMNRVFVSIKVDREERPDIDQIYVTARAAMGGQGGWPLTMFLPPDS